MLLSRKSPLTGKINEMEIPLTEEELDKGFLLYLDGKCIQDIFPKLSSEQREFIHTGYTPEDWKEMFPSEEEEEC